MNAEPRIEAYLEHVRKAMFGLSSKTKAGILEELREHLHELANEKGSIEAAIREMEEPRKLASGFREVYGYGPGFATLLVVTGVFTSLFTLPSLGGLSALTILILYAYAVLVGLYGGKRLGGLCGAAACAARVAAVAAQWYLSPGAYAFPETGALFLFALGSALLPVAGVLAGETKERYIKGRPLEF